MSASTILRLSFLSSAFLALSLGCSPKYFIGGGNEDIEINTAPTALTYCPQNAKLEIISDSSDANTSFTKFIQKLESKNVQLSFVDKAILFALIQSNYRPDLSSPTSKLLIGMEYNKKFHYIEVSSAKDQTYPYLKSLELILQEFQSKLTFKQLVELFDKEFITPVKVSLALNKSFNNLKPIILNNKILTEHYSRAGESLQSGEIIAKNTLSKLVVLNGKSKHDDFKINTQLFNHQHPSKTNILCNFDMSFYDESHYLISEQVIQSNMFALKEGENIFVASSSQLISDSSVIEGMSFFKGKSDSRSAAFCQTKIKDSTSQYWFLATNSRDPGQHIYHLLEHPLKDVTTLNELDGILSYPRHMFLGTPVRLIYEAERGGDEHLTNLLKINIPIYYADRLGEILSVFQKKERSHLIFDERSDANLICK